jgi:PAS domain S-box-containing protein
MARSKRFFSLDPDSKDITVVFRWLVILLLLSFIFFSPTEYSPRTFRLLLALIGVYIVSNAWISFLKEETVARFKINRAVLFVDIILISVIMYFIKGFETDLYLVYFLVIFVAAMQHGGIKRSWVTGLLAAGLYLGLYLRNNSLDSILSSYILLRIPFFFLVAVFSTYHSDRLRSEVSKRRQAEEASEQLFRQYKTLVDTIPDIIFELDAEGRFSFVSEGVREAGYDPRELIGRHFTVFLHPEETGSFSREVVLERFRGKVTGDENAPKLFDERRTKNRMTRNLTLRLRVRKGSPGERTGDSYIYAEMHSSGKWDLDPATGRPRLAGSIGIIRDVTESYRSKKEVEQSNIELQRTLAEVKRSHEELKKTQAQLLQSEKLASIGQLAAGIAHEVNNPLGFLSSNVSLLGRYVETLKSLVRTSRDLGSALDRDDALAVREGARLMVETAEGLDPEYFLEDADRLVRGTTTGVDRIKKIMSDLMAFSRKDEGVRLPCDVNELIEGVLNIVWNEIKYKAELRKELGDVPAIKCNSQQVSQVILNLILNAVQALEGPGEIAVRTFRRDGGVCFEVADNGKGIPEEIRMEIFEPFFTTKESGKGTGLGLSISLEIVKKHGGRIDVSSRVGRGTTFTVWLPPGEQGG